MAGSSVSWEELLSGIREAFSSQNVDIDGVKQLMSSYHSRREDWQQYAKFDTHRLAALSLKNVLRSCRTCCHYTFQPSSGTRGIWQTKAMAATTFWWCAGGRDTPRKLSSVLAVCPPPSPLPRRCCAALSGAIVHRFGRVGIEAWKCTHPLAGKVCTARSLGTSLCAAKGYVASGSVSSSMVCESKEGQTSTGGGQG